jgi:hypothetical protein
MNKLTNMSIPLLQEKISEVYDDNVKSYIIMQIIKKKQNQEQQQQVQLQLQKSNQNIINQQNIKNQQKLKQQALKKNNNILDDILKNETLNELLDDILKNTDTYEEDIYDNINEEVHVDICEDGNNKFDKKFTNEVKKDFLNNTMLNRFANDIDIKNMQKTTRKNKSFQPPYDI